MASETGAAVTRAFGPRQRVETVADAIARAIEQPVAEVYPHAMSRGLAIFNALAPGSAIGSFSASGGSRAAPMRHAIAISRSGGRRSRDAVRDAGGRALIVGGWVRDRLLLGDATSNEHRPRGVRRRRPIACARCSNPFGRVEAVGESFQVYKIGEHRRLAAAARIEGRARPSRLRRHRRSGHVDRGGGAAPRLHGQRDLVGSADRRVLRSVRRPRAISSAALLRVVDPRHLRRRQPARAARGAVRRALRASRSTRRPRDCAARSRSTICRPSASGASSKSCCFAPRPSIGFALAHGSRRRRNAVPGAAGARRLPAGARVASGRRRLGAHAAGDRPGARRASTICRGRSRSP